MNTKAIHLAVIGLGMASKPHLDGLSELVANKQVVVSGIHNRSKAKAESIASNYGFPVFDSVEAIAADESTDGVIVLTPPNQRQSIVDVLSKAGKHILSEKPLERTTAAAEQIVKQCEDAGIIFGVVFQHRFRKGAMRLTELLRNNELGDIAVVRADIPWWRDQDYYDVPGRGTYERDGGGVLISQAIHVLDLMLSLTGPAETVQALCATSQIHSMESEDFATAGVRFSSGAIGSIVATTAGYPGNTESITLDGTLASATISGGQLDVAWRDGRTEHVGEESGSGGTADPMAFPCDWHRDLIADFAESIRDARAPRITGREALRVHALIEAIVESSRDGKSVTVASHPE